MAVMRIWIASFFGPPPAAIGAIPVWIASGDGSVSGATEAVIDAYSGPFGDATAVWIASYGGPPPAAIGATPIFIGGYAGAGSITPPPVTSVWSASDAAANGMTLSNGGLTFTNPTVAYRSIRGTVSKTSSKLYVEFLANNPAANDNIFGLADTTFSVAVGSALGTSGNSAGIGWNGNSVTSGFTSNYVVIIAASPNDVLGMAVDFATGSIWIARNNVWVNSSNPSTAAAPIISFVPATVGALFPAISSYDANAVWTLQPTAASQHYLPPPGFQAWDGGPVTPAVSSVWSASDAAANGMTLSNGGLTVTPSGVVGNQAIRGSISHNAGKYYIEFLATAAPINENMMFGFADATFNATNEYLGSNGVSVGLQLAGAFYATSGFTNPSGIIIYEPAANDVFAIAVDLTAGKLWISVNNNWFNGGNPTTGIVPVVSIAAPALGVALFPGMTFYGTGNGVWTLQPTAASQKYAPPSGFSAWDAPPPPVTSVWSASDAAANGMTLSNGGLTVTDAVSPAVYGSIRGTIGHSTGKFYVEFKSGVATSGIDDPGFGLADASFNSVGYLSQTPTSVGIIAGATHATVANPTAGFMSNYTTNIFPQINDVWGMAVDLTTGNLWLSQNNVWLNGSNPASGSLPIATFSGAFSGLTYFPAMTLRQQATTPIWTLQPTAASQKYTPPSGFTPWG